MNSSVLEVEGEVAPTEKGVTATDWSFLVARTAEHIYYKKLEFALVFILVKIEDTFWFLNYANLSY